MLKYGLCTGPGLNLRDGIFAEIEKNSFITLLGKGRHSGLMASKLRFPHGWLLRELLMNIDL